MKTHAHLWQVWPGRRWPVSGIEELEFVESLEVLSVNSTTDWDRGDVTSLLNALRCGLSVADLLEVGPGLKPARLLGAYRHLEAMRADSFAAWGTLVDQPSSSRLTEFGPRAARLIATPVYRLTEASSSVSEGALHQAISKAGSAIRQISRRTYEIETRMVERGRMGDSEGAVKLGCLLYHPYQQGLWGHPYYLPSRVGTLTPSRVADLLEAV
jgi:hypothetical protein